MAKTRNTRQKEEIKFQIAELDSFFTAEELQQKLKGISLATIYRYLKKAVKDDELFSYTCNKRQLYSSGKRSHCHFICEKTGKIIHFDINNLDFLKDKIPGSIKSFQIEIRGICTECSATTK